MALIECPECGQNVSDRAAACPNCGYPVSAMIEKQKKDIDDLYDLGCKYLYGIGMPKDIDIGIEYLRKAAEQGHSKAQYSLGVMYELIESKGYGKGSGFLRLLLHNGQAISISVMYDISKAQFDDIGNAQSKVGFEYQGGCDALIWSASGKALLHGGNDCLVLFSGYSDGFLVHGIPPDR